MRKRTLGIAAAICILIAAIATPFSFVIFGRFADSVINNLVSGVSEKLDLTLETGKVSPRLLGSVRVDAVRLSRADGSKLLSVKSFVVHYSLISMLLGKNDEILRGIDIDSPVLSLDLKSDSDLPARISRLLGSAESSTLPVFSVTIRNLEAGILSTQSEAFIKCGLLRFRGKEDFETASISETSYTIKLQSMPSISGQLTATIRLGDSRDELSGFVRTSISSGSGFLVPADFTFSISETGLAVKGKLGEGATFRLDRTKTDGRSLISVLFDRFVPVSISRQRDVPVSVKELMSLPFSGKASVLLEKDLKIGSMVIDIASQDGFASLNKDKIPGAASGQTGLILQASGTPKLIKIPRMSLVASGYAGSFVGDMSLENVSVSGQLAMSYQGISADFAVAGKNEIFRAVSPAIETPTISYENAVAILELGRNRPHFTFTAGKSSSTGREISLSGSLDGSGSGAFKAEMEVHNFRTGSLMELPASILPLQIAETVRGGTLSGSLNFETGIKEYSWRSPGLVFKNDDFEIEASGAGNSVQSDIRGIRFVAGNVVLEGNAALYTGQRDKGELSRLALDLVSRGKSYKLAGTLSPDGTVDVTGDYGLSIFSPAPSLSEGSSSRFVQFSAKDIPLPVPGMSSSPLVSFNGEAFIDETGVSLQASRASIKLFEKNLPSSFQFGLSGVIPGARKSSILVNPSLADEKRIRATGAGPDTTTNRSSRSLDLSFIELIWTDRTLTGNGTVSFGEDGLDGSSFSMKLESLEQRNHPVPGLPGTGKRHSEERWELAGSSNPGSSRITAHITGFPLNRVFKGLNDEELSVYLSLSGNSQPMIPAVGTEGEFQAGNARNPAETGGDRVITLNNRMPGYGSVAGPSSRVDDTSRPNPVQDPNRSYSLFPVKGSLMAGVIGSVISIPEQKFDVTLSGNRLEVSLKENPVAEIRAVYGISDTILSLNTRFDHMPTSAFMDVHAMPVNTGWKNLMLDGRLQAKIPVLTPENSNFSVSLKAHSILLAAKGRPDATSLMNTGTGFTENKGMLPIEMSAEMKNADIVPEALPASDLDHFTGTELGIEMSGADGILDIKQFYVKSDVDRIDISGKFGIPASSAHLSGSVRLGYDVDSRGRSTSPAGIFLQVPHPLTADFSASGERGTYLLEISQARYGVLDLSDTRMSLQFTQGLRSDFKGLAASLDGSLTWQGLRYPIFADLDATGKLRLESGSNCSVVIKSAPGKWLVSATLDALPFALGRGQDQILLNGLISGEYELNGSSWLVKSESLGIRSAGGKESSIPDMDLTFSATPDSIRFTKIRINQLETSELSGTATLTIHDDNRADGSLTLNSGKGSLVIAGTLVDRQVSGTVTAIELDSRHVNPRAVPGYINGSLEIRGSLDSIISSITAWQEGKVQPRNENARLNGNLSIGFRTEHERVAEQQFEFLLDGNSVELQSKSKHGIELTGTCNLASGDVSLKVGLDDVQPVKILMPQIPAENAIMQENPDIRKSLELLHFSGSIEASGTLRHMDTMRWKARVLGKGAMGKKAQPVVLALDLEAVNLQTKISKLSVATRSVALDYSGKFDLASLEAQGIVNISAGLDQPSPVKTRMAVSGTAGSYDFSSDGLLAGGLVYRNPSFKVLASHEEYKITGSIGIPESETGHMSILAHIMPGAENPSLESEIGFTAFRSEMISSLLAAFNLVDIGNLTRQSKLDGSVFFMSDFSSLAWNATSLLVTGKDYSLRCSGSGNEIYAELSDASFKSSSAELTGSGRIIYRDRTKNDVTGIILKLRSGTLEYAIEGTLDKDGKITAKGNHGITVEAVRQEDGYRFTFGASDLPIPLPQGNTIVSTAFTLTGSITGTSLIIDSGTCLVKDSGGKESVLPQLSFRMENSKDGMEILDCVLQWKDRMLVGRGSLGWSKGLVEFSLGLEDPVSSGGSGAERWSMTASAGSDGVYIEAQLLGIPASSLLSVLLSPDQVQLAQNFGGTIDLIVKPRKDSDDSKPDLMLAKSRLTDLIVSGQSSLQDKRPQLLPLEFSFRLTNGEYLSTPLALDFSGAFDDTVFEVRELDLKYQGHQINGASLSLDVKTLVSTFFIPYLGVIGGSRVRLGLEGSGGIMESVASSEGNSTTGKAYRLETQIVAGTIGNTDVLGRKYWMTIGTSGIRIESSASEIAGNFSSDGTMELIFGGDFPVRGRLKGSLGSSINLEISDLDADIPWLSSTFLPGVLVFPAGRATGSFTVTGSPDDPSIRGDVMLRSVVLTLPEYLEESIGPFDVPLALEGETFSFLAGNVQIGAGVAEISTEITLDHWVLTALTVDVKTTGDATVGISGKIVGIEIENGKASIDVKIALDADILRISGRMNLERGEVTVNPSAFMVQNTETPSQGLKIYLDASFGFGRKVRVYLPSRDLPVIMGNADPSSTLELELDTETGEYRLDGIVTLRGGYAIYYLRNFFLRQGQIEFSESISGFDPRISFLAENREANNSGPVLVSLTADNQRLSRLSPALSSDPPLRESEIVALLGGGVLPAESGQIGLREAFVGSSEFIPQLDFSKAFEQRVRDALGLDVLYLRSSFLQRWIYTISDPDVREAKSLGSYLDNTYLYAGKYFGKAAFIHAALRLREDPLVAPTGLRLDSELGLEFETPIGFLRWTVSPRHLDSLFIRDQSISLSWKIPF